MSIDPKRLKDLRKQKRLSRADLAHKSHISQRQIARLESTAAEGSKVRDRTINELAKALDVEPGVLTGELPIPEAFTPLSRRGARRPRQVSAWIQPEVSLAYALIKMRYGVNLTTLVNAAPLMFVLLAEGSFVWRREKLNEIEEALKSLFDLSAGYRRFPAGLSDVHNGARLESASIENRDLFGEEVVESWEHGLGHNPEKYNPFADFLRELSEMTNFQDMIEIWPDWINDRGPLKGFPQFSVCTDAVDRFTAGSEKLNTALEFGFLRLDHMPEELLTDDAVDKRKEWLELQFEKLPAKAKEFVKDNLAFYESFRASLTTGKGADQ
ncbi:MAG: helix-turn-helix transcriptional regulator [Rhodobacteraceae bacterium]|nr:helix-turn-helix transcriptional regulator [Paracoccaceae bacterium]